MKNPINLLLIMLVLLASMTSCEDDCTQSAQCTMLSSQNHGKSSVSGDKVYVCHNGETLEISANALKAHLGHGDTAGECTTLSSSSLEFKDGEVVQIACSYTLPFIHTTEAGTQWRYSEPDK